METKTSLFWYQVDTQFSSEKCILFYKQDDNSNYFQI